MGLIDRAENALVQETGSPAKKKTGLLGKVSHASLYDALTSRFFDWLSSVKADRGGLLCSHSGGPWSLLCAQGLDFTSINRFSPPPKLMEETFKGSAEWRNLSGKDLPRFHGFFSSREAESLKVLHLRDLGLMGEVRVCVVLAESGLSMHRSPLKPEGFDRAKFDELVGQIRDAAKILPLLTPGPATDQGPVEEKVRSLLGSGMTAVLISLSLEKIFGSPERIATDSRNSEIYRALVSRIKKKAGASNIVRVCDDFTVKVVLFSSQKIDFAMYVKQLFVPLEKAFGIPRISQIALENGGTVDSFQDIISFIRGGS